MTPLNSAAHSVFNDKKLLTDLIGALLLALVVVVGYKLSPLLLPVADITLTPEAGCDLQAGPCRAVLPGGGSLSLEIGPRPIPVVAPLSLTVRLEGKAADQGADGVEVDLAGVDMNMGFNRPRLSDQGAGRFVGEATLPVCVTGHMDWQATVLLLRGRERIAVPLRFSTLSH